MSHHQRSLNNAILKRAVLFTTMGLPKKTAQVHLIAYTCLTHQTSFYSHTRSCCATLRKKQPEKLGCHLYASSASSQRSSRSRMRACCSSAPSRSLMRSCALMLPLHWQQALDNATQQVICELKSDQRCSANQASWAASVLQGIHRLAAGHGNSTPNNVATPTYTRWPNVSATSKLEHLRVHHKVATHMITS